VCALYVNPPGLTAPNSATGAESESGNSGQARDGEGSGLFLTAAIISHSCRENAMHRPKGQRLAMLALEPIPAGSEITWSYLGYYTLTLFSQSSTAVRVCVRPLTQRACVVVIKQESAAAHTNQATRALPEQGVPLSVRALPGPYR
jgi:hypothetical protein